MEKIANCPKVHIIDDDVDMRHAIAMLVRSVGLPSAIYSSARDFLERCPLSASGCLIVDVRMPEMSGLELQLRLRERGFNLQTIIMTGYGDIAMAVRAMRAGAIDFIEKPFNDQLLLDRVQEAISVSERAQDADEERCRIVGKLAHLTPRESEVMFMIVAGQLNKLIADRLGLSTRTVEIHRARIMEKMAAKSLPELVRMVLLIEHPDLSEKHLKRGLGSREGLLKS